MKGMRIVTSSVLMLLGASAYAEDALEAIRDETRRVMNAYESRISALEARLAQTEAAVKKDDAKAE